HRQSLFAQSMQCIQAGEPGPDDDHIEAADVTVHIVSSRSTQVAENYTVISSVGQICRLRRHRVKVPFTWRVTGWFMIGWSAEFPRNEVRPLRYFGEDLVAYRDDSGDLHVMSGHCRHLGAHIGHGGKVVGDCVECPFHGWRWGPDGTNRYIPYQPDRPNKALRLRVFPVREQYDCVFIWHQPDGKEPQWEMPDIFRKFPQFDTDPAAYYRAYPEF